MGIQLRERQRQRDILCVRDKMFFVLFLRVCRIVECVCVYEDVKREKDSDREKARESERENVSV